MTQTEQLIASLTATDNRSYNPGGNAYFDWSTQLDDGVRMEVGDEEGTVAVLELTEDQVLALQQRLTAWLLTRRAA